MSSDLLVLGAGPAGLAAAWRAARRGRSVTVLERAPGVGGMAASFEVAGIRVDYGSHRLHPATPPALLGDLRALLGADLQVRSRNGRLRVADRWVGFPLRPVELARTLPPTLLAAVARDSVTAPLRRVGEPSYAAVLRKGLGPSAYEALYAPYAEKLWGLPGEAISADQARRRVRADTPWKLVARLVRPPRGRLRGSGQGRTFCYPRRGFGAIVEALADAAVAAGAVIHTGAEVVRLDLGSDRMRASLADGRQLSAGHAFSTIPLPVLARLARPGPPPAALEAGAGLRFRSMLLVYLVLDRRPWTPYDAHYLPGRETPVTRISEPTNYRDSLQDPPRRTVLCAEIPCARGDELWTSSDAELAQIVVQTVLGTGLPPVRPVKVAVRRLAHVYPVYELDYQRRLAGLDAWAEQAPGLTTFGRLGLFAHDNTHHALAMAYDAVDALGDGQWDAGAWRAARARFAAHVVED